MTRQHVTVALSGDGADELLAGYETYQANELARWYRRIPRWAHERILAPLIRRLPPSEGKISLDHKLKRFVEAARLAPERAHCAWRIIFNEAQKRRLLAPAIAGELSNWDTFDLCRAYFGSKVGLNQFLAFDTRFYLPSDMLTKIDRMSMAHALEVRVPFLDHEVVEFVSALPPSLKLLNYAISGPGSICSNASCKGACPKISSLGRRLASMSRSTAGLSTNSANTSAMCCHPRPSVGRVSLSRRKSNGCFTALRT
jgi:asparagine synthase (glutamine-hydrolysing)